MTDIFTGGNNGYSSVSQKAARGRRTKMIDDVIAGEGRIISLMNAAKLLGTSYPTVHRMV